MDQWYRRILATLGVILELLILLALARGSGLTAYVLADVSARLLKTLLRLVVPLGIALLILGHSGLVPLLHAAMKTVGRIRERILVYIDNRQEYSDRVTGTVQKSLDTVINILKDDHENKDI